MLLRAIKTRHSGYTSEPVLYLIRGDYTNKGSSSSVCIWSNICIYLVSVLNKECQKALFSATYDDNVMNFAKKIIPDPVILRLKKEELSLDNIKQFYVRCQNEEDKFKALANIYGTISVGQAMVFCHVS